MADAVERFADLAGLELMPWQVTAARHMTGLTADGRWSSPEVCVVVSRQNGKTTLLVPRILLGLVRGERIGHAAQSREVPRATFLTVAAACESVPALRAMLASPPRLANGQEEISFTTGGSYRIFASTTQSMRGWALDTLIVDEVREQRDTTFAAVSEPTLTASSNPQTIYVSNAGDEASVILNGLRARAGEPGLAYVEWSADPTRASDDRDGWAEANPALGHTIRPETLERAFRSLPRERFETEHLCRWVTSMRPRLVAAASWDRCAATRLEPAVRPAVGVAVDPSGLRVSAVAAWTQRDGTIAVTSVGEWSGDPVDLVAVAADLEVLHPAAWVVDPWTDGELARLLGTTEQVAGRDSAAAAAHFVRAVEGGRIRHQRAEQVGADLAWTERKPRQDGTYTAVRGERPVTAALAAVRAVWRAGRPDPHPAIY